MRAWCDGEEREEVEKDFIPADTQGQSSFSDFSRESRGFSDRTQLIACAFMKALVALGWRLDTQCTESVNATPFNLARISVSVCCFERGGEGG